jgi:hypothetical protein
MYFIRKCCPRVALIVPPQKLIDIGHSMECQMRRIDMAPPARLEGAWYFTISEILHITVLAIMCKTLRESAPLVRILHWQLCRSIDYIKQEVSIVDAISIIAASTIRKATASASMKRWTHS